MSELEEVRFTLNTLITQVLPAITKRLADVEAELEEAKERYQKPRAPRKQIDYPAVVRIKEMVAEDTPIRVIARELDMAYSTVASVAKWDEVKVKKKFEHWKLNKEKSNEEAKD